MTRDQVAIIFCSHDHEEDESCDGGCSHGKLCRDRLPEPIRTSTTEGERNASER